jgi:hypothetical protein
VVEQKRKTISNFIGKCGFRRNRQRSVAIYIYIYCIYMRPNKSTKIISTDNYQAKSQNKQPYRYTTTTSAVLGLVIFYEDSNTLT